jgi:hypothetical protein
MPPQQGDGLLNLGNVAFGLRAHGDGDIGISGLNVKAHASERGARDFAV